MRDAIEVVPDIRGRYRSRPADALIAALAERQHGVVARRQLVTLGLSLDAIDHRVQARRLHVLHHGVYAVGHRSLTRCGHWMAAVLAGGNRAVLSHRTAAALWGIRDTARGSIEITAPRERRRPGIVVRIVALPADEVTIERGIPVTTPARTLLDLAAVLTEHQLTRAAERAEALRLTSPTSLEALVERYPRRPGTPAVKRLIEGRRIRPTTTRSDLERRFLTLLDAESLPRPLVNAEIHLNETTKLEPDFTWRSHRLIVELDGYETHGTREGFERDRARDRALQSAGWRVLRITWRQLHADPATIAAELHALLSRTARSETTGAPAPRPGRRTPAPPPRRAAR
jgi:very-short-patch-repair endonuclease/predicted transcriptional regulator of viral defense system